MKPDEEPDYLYLEGILLEIYELNASNIRDFLFDWEDSSQFKLFERRSRKVKKTKIVQNSPISNENILILNNISLDSEDECFTLKHKANSNNKIFKVESQDSLRMKGRSTSSANKLSKIPFERKPVSSFSSKCVSEAFRVNKAKSSSKYISSVLMPEVHLNQFKRSLKGKIEALVGDDKAKSVLEFSCPCLNQLNSG